MKKLFISQPMKGKSDEDILKERNKAIAEAERLCGGGIGFFLPGRTSRC